MTTTSDIKTEKLLIDSLFTKSVREKKVPALTNFSIKKLTGDASSRSYFRIKGQEGAYVACLDQSLTVLKNIDDVDFFAAQKVLSKHNVSVPNILHVDFMKGYVLQEDLGDVTLLKTLSLVETKEEEFKYYKSAIDELIKIHLVSINDLKGTIFKARAFDVEKLMSEIDFTITHLIDGLFDPSVDKTRKSLIRINFKEIIEEVALQERVLTHRDFHSRNLMYTQGNLKVIDFQDMRMGIPQYDVVSLLEDCYYKIDNENKEKLKEYYWKEAQKHKILKEGPNFEWENFKNLYNKIAIQRTFKALGSFAFIYRKRKDIRYFRYIGYSFEQLKGFMFSSEEYKDLRKLLSEVYYEY